VTAEEQKAITLRLREQLLDLADRIDGWGGQHASAVLMNMTEARAEFDAIGDTLIDLTVELRDAVRDESRRAIADVEHGTSRLGVF
jgi:hypothetical protein